MKKRTQRFLAALTTATALGVVVAVLAGCGTTRTYTMTYSHAETLLFTRLHLDKDSTLRNPRLVQARAEDKLMRPMSMKLFAVDLHSNTPGQYLSFTCHHLYNIGAVGGQYIRFDLKKEGDDKTSITVDYCDRWRGMWPPFVFWNPGPGRERKIHNAIWGNESANQAFEAIGDPGSPQSQR